MKLVIITIATCILICLLICYIIYRKNMKLLCSVSSPNRGTRSERKLIIKMLKTGIHPLAIYHDLYIEKRNGDFSQIDIVVASPQGLISIEVKDYSGWIFGNERNRYWTQVLNYGKEKYRFYNPIIQNEGHIKSLKELSNQFAKLPIFNVVLFAGNCTLKNITFNSENVFVGYASNITHTLNRIAVNNGNNPYIVNKHIANVQRLANTAYN